MEVPFRSTDFLFIFSTGPSLSASENDINYGGKSIRPSPNLSLAEPLLNLVYQVSISL